MAEVVSYDSSETANVTEVTGDLPELAKLVTQDNVCGCIFGNCVEEPSRKYCLCWSGYHGRRCMGKDVIDFGFSSKQRSPNNSNNSSSTEIFTSGLVVIAFLVVGVFIWRRYRNRRNSLTSRGSIKSNIEGYSTPDGRNAYSVVTPNRDYIPTNGHHSTSIYTESECGISDNADNQRNRTATYNGSSSVTHVNTRSSRQERHSSKPIQDSDSKDRSPHKAVPLPALHMEQLV